VQGLTRLLLGITILSLVAAFYIFDAHQFFTLDYIKSQQDSLIAFRDQQLVFTVVVFAGVYIAVTALSLPGATIMTLLAGAVFGLFNGTIIVSVASTIGATLAFLVSRFLLREYVQTRFSAKLVQFNQGMEKDGVFYLFSLRLIPVVPFFVINLVMGLTKIRTWQFFFVSQAGMLAGTIVYVNAGSQLADLDSLAGILSPALILSFALLGIFPLLAKKMVSILKRNGKIKKYKRPRNYDFNLIVMGGGSAGLVTAYIGAAVKAKVALIEKHRMGGDCLNTGCVPSKSLIRSAKILSYIKRAKEFGFKQASVDFEFAEVMERVQRVIREIEPHDSVERYTGLGVKVIEGDAKIVSPYEVEVNGERMTTKNIVIATGARPFVPSIAGLKDIEYVTSDTLWELRNQPKRMLVLGGGPIGCELSQAFQRLGTKVTLIQRDKHLMPREDDDVSELIVQRFKSEGIEVLLEHEVVRFEKTGGYTVAICKGPQGEIRIECDLVFVALGRQANVSGFGLESLDVKLQANGTIEADEFLRTNYPNIYVCGDVAGPYQFTHVAAHQAWYAAVNALFSPFKKFRVDYSVIPWATYTDPEIAQVGLNEKVARVRGIDFEVTRYGIDDLDRAIAEQEAYGFIKVLTVPGKDSILGVTIVGHHAAELIAEYVLAMKHGIGLNKILGTIHIYPTLSEANKYVAGNWKKAHAPERLLSWVSRFHAWRRGV